MERSATSVPSLERPAWSKQGPTAGSRADAKVESLPCFHRFPTSLSLARYRLHVRRAVCTIGSSSSQDDTEAGARSTAQGSHPSFVHQDDSRQSVTHRRYDDQDICELDVQLVGASTTSIFQVNKLRFGALQTAGKSVILVCNGCGIFTCKPSRRRWRRRGPGRRRRRKMRTMRPVKRPPQMTPR